MTLVFETRLNEANESIVENTSLITNPLNEPGRFPCEPAVSSPEVVVMQLRIGIIKGMAMNIGQTARLSAYPQKYPPLRGYRSYFQGDTFYSGYRHYDERDMHILRFIRRVRAKSPQWNIWRGTSSQACR